MRVLECGTPTGYRAHNERGEKPCESCRTARSDDARRRHACECGRWKHRARDLTCPRCEKTDVPLTGGAWVQAGLTQAWVAA